MRAATKVGQQQPCKNLINACVESDYLVTYFTKALKALTGLGAQSLRADIAPGVNQSLKGLAISTYLPAKPAFHRYSYQPRPTIVICMETQVALILVCKS